MGRTEDRPASAPDADLAAVILRVLGALVSFSISAVSAGAATIVAGIGWSFAAAASARDVS